MTESLDAFRTEVREFLKANCPPAMRQRLASEDDPPCGDPTFQCTEPLKLWLEAVPSSGWTIAR